MTLPIGLREKSGKDSTRGTITLPAIQGSAAPGLLGLTALQMNRAVIDFSKKELNLLGPAPYDLEKTLPPGTDCYPLLTAPSGHLVLPCCEYSGKSQGEEGLVLMSEQVPSPRDLKTTPSHATNKPQAPPGLKAKKDSGI